MVRILIPLTRLVLKSPLSFTWRWVDPSRSTTLDYGFVLLQDVAPPPWKCVPRFPECR